VTDSFDRRILVTYLEEYMGDFIFDTDVQPFFFSRSEFDYKVIPWRLPYISFNSIFFFFFCRFLLPVRSLASTVPSTSFLWGTVLRCLDCTATLKSDTTGLNFFDLKYLYIYILLWLLLFFLK
jgi:hypothetical protein